MPAALYREAARETLALLEEEGYTEQVAALLLHVDNDVAAAEGLLAGLLAKRDQWWRHLRGGAQRAELERALANLSRERMQQAREAVPEVFAEAILAAVRYAAGNVARRVRFRRWRRARMCGRCRVRSSRTSRSGAASPSCS